MPFKAISFRSNDVWGCFQRAELQFFHELWKSFHAKRVFFNIITNLPVRQRRSLLSPAAARGI